VGAIPGDLLATLGDRSLRSIAGSDRVDAVARALQKPLKRLLARPLGKRIKDLLNGTWLGHPLHPAVTDIPLGSWAVAAALDFATIAGWDDLDRAAGAAQKVGIAGAALSALSGFADWSDTGRGQRRVGLVHAGLNVVALGLVVASVCSRGRRPRIARALSLAGFGTAAASGWLGGALVFGMGTQVDRNAESRKLKEFTHAMADAELPPERPTRVVVRGIPILLVRKGTRIFALHDVCSHAGCPLSTGRLEGDAIVCPCHGSTFRLHDGRVLHGPSPYRQPTFEARVVDGDIEVRSQTAGPRMQKYVSSSS